MSNLEYDAVGHRYSVGGVEVPGVTRVISEGLLGDRRWEDEAAMWRGSVVHSCCELEERGTLDEASVDPAAAGYLAAWRKCKRENRFETVEIEEAHCDESGRFAGRRDLVVIMDGKRTVIDWKTGSVGVGTPIQLAAYAVFDGTMERLAVRLQENGKYTFMAYSPRDLRRDFNVFLSALAVWNWRKERRML
jgi:hypothetical protein